MKPSGPGLLFIGSFNYRFNFIAGNRSVHMLYFFLVRSRELVPKNLFISSRLSLLLEYICLEDSGTSWGEPRCLGLPGGPALSPQPRGQLPRVFRSLFGCCRPRIRFEARFRTSHGFCSPAHFREPCGRLEIDPTLQQRLPLHQNLLPMCPAQSPLLSEYRNGEGAEALLQIRKGATCILQPSDI